MTLKIYITCLIVVLLSIGMVSAQTLIAGKVYDSEFNKIVSDATVKVTCEDKTLTTKTLDDGTYAVKFKSGECGLGVSAGVYVEKSGLIGNGDGEVSECGEDCDEEYFSIINININSKKTYSGGGGGSYSGNVQPILWFICGNDFCDNGETAETCSKDCYVEPETENQEEIIELTYNEEENIREPGFSKWEGITGAAVAVGNHMNIPILAGILGFLIVLLIGHKIIQKRN